MEIRPQRIERRWSGLGFVAASGPSLTQEQIDLVRGHRLVVVNDAYQLAPWADVLYAVDAPWWRKHQGCPDFAGEKWMGWREDRRALDVRSVIKQYRLRTVHAIKGAKFSQDPALIYEGQHSGFQAIQIAYLSGLDPVGLLGFDYRNWNHNQKTHFFGDHPTPLKNTKNFIPWLKVVAEAMPPPVHVINCTPGSACPSFPKADLREVLNGSADRHAAA